METKLPLATTVADLIKALKKYPQDSSILLGSATDSASSCDKIVFLKKVPLEEKFQTEKTKTVDLVIIKPRLKELNPSLKP